MREFSPEAFEKLRRHVQKRLLKSELFPEHQADPVNPYSVAAHIVSNAWRQPDPYYFADLDIELAIRYPPDPIDSKHFSLKAFIEQK